MPSLVGTQIDKYDMLEEVGHGGMAVVYRGLDSVLKREVAVKVLHAHLADREESRRRLEREAIAVAQLRHENILEIFDYSGPEADESYIVTEFIRGPTLRQWLDDKPTPRPAIAAMIVHRLARALTVAHDTGIVHRDVKPENVMIRRDDGCVKLMDFGIAQILDNQKLTLTGQLIGSPAYMAPELISGRPLDARTDLFSLGILLYQLATGELPFAGRNPHEVLNRIADGQYPAPSTVCPMVDRDLEAIIGKALASNPDDRYQTAETLAKDLEDYLEEMGLEPTSGEISAYFEDPDGYIAELDERVSATLMVHANAATKEGYTARAIRLLGRVLEIDAGHKEARQVLDRLRTRERRLRQLLVAGGALAAIGLLGAGVMLVGGQAPTKVAKAHAGLAAPPPAKVAPAVPPDPTPPDADPPPDPPPAKADPVPPTPPTATGGNGGRRPMRVASKPKTTRCNLRFEGPPVGSMSRLMVRVNQNGQLQKKLPMQQALDVQFAGIRAELRVDSKTWGAKRVLTRQQCEAGPIKVKVAPRDAQLRFELISADTGQASAAPSGMAIRCLKNCPGKIKGNYTPQTFPPIPMDGMNREVELEFKLRGFKTGSKPVTLRPGPQRVTVRLEPVT